jgi:exodeoxyribonuclease V alpha subunit
MKDGRPVIPSQTLDPGTGLNFRHIEESDPERIKEIIRELVCDRLPKKRGYDPLWDIQVISPMNERTPLSCLHLNEMLQAAINPGEIPKGLPFRLGDKVLQRKNEIIGDIFVVNGDLGQIVDVNEKLSYVSVLFLNPERLVSVNKFAHSLCLAYAITIHKMQGSESPVIIIPVHNSFGGFFNRELIYTAISRAQEICITVGQWGAVEVAARRIGINKRITRLTEELSQ